MRAGACVCSYAHSTFTVDTEKFAGLNFHGFNPTKALWKYFHISLAMQKCLLLKRGAYIHGKNFRGALENLENRESLAQ